MAELYRIPAGKQNAPPRKIFFNVCNHFSPWVVPTLISLCPRSITNTIRHTSPLIINQINPCIPLCLPATIRRLPTLFLLYDTSDSKHWDYPDWSFLSRPFLQEEECISFVTLTDYRCQVDPLFLVQFLVRSRSL